VEPLEHFLPGELIRAARAARGVSQRALSAVTGSTSYLHRLEHDEISPTVERLGKLATALGYRLVLRFEPLDTENSNG
jgi:transcriptional regulator with XRE-family HTH domain